MKYIECPNCGSQTPYKSDDGRLLRLFDLRLKNREFQEALKGNYKTWTCSECGRKFIRSNVVCDCSDGGVVVKSEEYIPKFVCSTCGR